jgi:hypothetical protein
VAVLKDWNRVPQWAQKEYEATKTRAEKAERERDSVLAWAQATVEQPHPDSPIYVEGYTPVSMRRYRFGVPVTQHGHETVNFRLSRNQVVRLRLEVDARGLPYVEVRSDGLHPVTIQASSSNTFYVHFRE